MRALVVVLTLLPTTGWTEIVSAAPESVEVTIYRGRPVTTADLADEEANQGIGMITETRVLDLPAGVSTVKFLDVAATVVPQSAKFESLPGQIVETNFDYSLIAPGELIAKSIGKTVTLVRTDKKTGAVTEQKAIVRSGPGGVMLEIDGNLEALDCGGLREKIVFNDIPAELTEKPTLSTTMRVTKAGTYRVRLSYLALGFSWSADYVARINRDGKTLDLTAWVTLANKQTTSFVNAPVQVIAGEISVIADETVLPEINIPDVETKCWPVPFHRVDGTRYRGLFSDQLKSVALAAPSEVETVVVTGSFIAEQRELGDYKLYALPEPTTVAAQQIKQVRMLDERRVPFERIYAFAIHPIDLENESAPQRPMSIVRLQNEKRAGLGKPLPAGIVSVLEPTTNERLVLAGEHNLRDVPIGLPVDIELGESMDVWVKPRVVREYMRGFFSRARPALDVEVELTNDKSMPVKVELYQGMLDQGEFKIASESTRHTLKKGMPAWIVTVKPHERATLRYTMVIAAPPESLE